MVRFSMYSGECLNEEEENRVNFDIFVGEGNIGFNPLCANNGFTTQKDDSNGFEHRRQEVGIHPRTQVLVTHPLRLGMDDCNR